MKKIYFVLLCTSIIILFFDLSIAIKLLSLILAIIFWLAIRKLCNLDSLRNGIVDDETLKSLIRNYTLSDLEDKCYKIVENYLYAYTGFKYQFIKKYTTPESFDNLEIELKNLKKQNEHKIYNSITFKNISFSSIKKIKRDIIIDCFITISLLEHATDNNSLTNLENEKETLIEREYLVSFISNKPLYISYKCPHCGNEELHHKRKLCKNCRFNITNYTNDFIIRNIQITKEKVLGERIENLHKLKQMDHNFNEVLFIAKADNILYKLYTGIMVKDIENIKHFLSNKIYNNYNKIIDYYKKQKQIHVYDELQINSTKIKSVSITKNIISIEVEFHLEYKEFNINEIDNSIDKHYILKEEFIDILTFTKKIVHNDKGLSVSCKNCGANMDLYRSGKCQFCDSIFPLENYDYILSNVNTSHKKTHIKY